MIMVMIIMIMIKLDKCTGNTFLKNKIEDKYNLEIYLQFFTDWYYKKWRPIAWSVKKILKILILKFLEQRITDYLCNQNVVIVKIKSHDL